MSKQIVEQLREAREAYYEDGTSPLSDADYDALEDELRAVDPDAEILKEVGVEPQSSWPKVQHSIPMGSLFKVQNKEQWNKWVSKFPDKTIFAVTEKFDGISISIEYYNGNIVRALTRGDGIIGEDITQNVVKMKNVQKVLYRPFTGWLRGEIVLCKSDHKQYLSDKKNPRNAAAGTAKRLDGVNCEHLTVQYYEAICPEKPFYSLTEQYNFMDNNGFKTTMCMSVFRPEEVPLIVDVWHAQQREQLDYEIDGLVIRVNIQDEFESWGVTDNRPKGAIAYKFPPIEKATTVTGITWQVGRTGRVTPVAELEPVDIGGVTIKRVSLHTARMALNSQAGPGARVIVSRRNDVIPYVEKVLPGTEQEIHEPTHLGDLEWDGEYLRVSKLDDTTNLYNSIKIWVQRLRILHWGDSFIRMLIDYGLVKTLGDLYRLDWDKVAEFAGKGIAKRARESLVERQRMDFASFISALNIRYCDHGAKDLVKNGVTNFIKLLELTEDEIAGFEGFGKTKAKHIVASIRERDSVIRDVCQYVYIVEKTGPLVGKSFCFTGAMETPRDVLMQMVVDNGGEAKKSVTKGLTYLVMADPNSGTVKTKKARKNGVKCINEKQFLEMCQ